MRETLGAIAGAVLAYAACAFVIGDLNAMAWTQDARFACTCLMLTLGIIGGMMVLP